MSASFKLEPATDRAGRYPSVNSLNPPHFFLCWVDSLLKAIKNGERGRGVYRWVSAAVRARKNVNRVRS